MAGPALQAGCCAALCSSHPPSLMDLAGNEGEGWCFSQKPSFKKSYSQMPGRRAVLPRCTLWPARAVPEAGGGLWAGLQPGGGCHGNEPRSTSAPSPQRPGLGEMPTIKALLQMHDSFFSSPSGILSYYQILFELTKGILPSPLHPLNTDSAESGFPPTPSFPFCPVSFFWWLLKGQMSLSTNNHPIIEP